jgi:hypothetical protein
MNFKHGSENSGALDGRVRKLDRILTQILKIHTPYKAGNFLNS